MFTKASVLLDSFQSQLPHPITQQKVICSLWSTSNATSSRKPSPLQSMHADVREIYIWNLVSGLLGHPREEEATLVFQKV